jgi:serine phosphatase RsbU (regulator of sigma subunit)
MLAGDFLLLYTDGLVEINCHQGKDLVKMMPLLKRIAPGDDYHRRLLGAALEDAGASDFSDDVTLLTAKLM